jgi:hypothetical protein
VGKYAWAVDSSVPFLFSLAMAKGRGCSQPFGRAHEWDLPLSVGLRDDRHVRAMCACGVVVVLDMRPWADEQDLPLSRFEDRVRCTRCGARSVHLEVWFGPQRAKPQDAIYMFR